MKVLIVENEIYLAQSISQKLYDFDFVCDIVTKVSEIDKNVNYDIVLLSTSIDGFNSVIDYYKNSIILLLVSYVSQDTVTAPIKAGASDYIQKPFMIEELIRKMTFFIKYKNLSNLNNTYINFIKSNFYGVNIEKELLSKSKPPLLIRSNYEKYADCFAFNYSLESNLPINIINLDSVNVEKLELKPNVLYYLKNYQVLKQNDKQILQKLIPNYPCIVHSSNIEEEINIKTINFIDNDIVNLDNDILTIDSYIKYIILRYQDMYPDTELSKKLGISRKSLWERRKKYDISKKK